MVEISLRFITSRARNRMLLSTSNSVILKLFWWKWYYKQQTKWKKTKTKNCKGKSQTAERMLTTSVTKCRIYSYLQCSTWFYEMQAWQDDFCSLGQTFCWVGKRKLTSGSFFPKATSNLASKVFSKTIFPSFEAITTPPELWEQLTKEA